MELAPTFDDAFRQRLQTLLVWRRDVRRFRPDPVAPEVLDRLLDTACLAPSVGLSQPWRFVLVDDPDRRRAVQAEFERCNAEALATEPHHRAGHYARLKLSGLREAPVQIGVYADHGTAQGHGLGRRTMPETITYSVVMAIHTLWLVTRAEGIGLGWVSILNPDRMTALLNVPCEWVFVGYLCLGFPEQEDTVPELEREAWEWRRSGSPCFRLQR